MTIIAFYKIIFAIGLALIGIVGFLGIICLLIIKDLDENFKKTHKEGG